MIFSFVEEKEINIQDMVFLRKPVISYTGVSMCRSVGRGSCPVSDVMKVNFHACTVVPACLRKFQ